MSGKVCESNERRKWKEWVKEAENSPWECDPKRALCAVGPRGGERGHCLLLCIGVFGKQNFVNKQKCTRGILFHH